MLSKRIINYLKDLLGFHNAISGPIIKDPSLDPQTATPELVREQLTNPITFHNKEYKAPLTVNALVHGGTLKQRDFMRNAINVLRHIVVSDLFQDMCLEHGPFFDTEDDPLTIYKNFISGKDLYDTYADRELEVDMHLYRSRWFWQHSTIGYTYPNTRKTWINMRHIDIYEYEMMAKVVGNIVHEYMHNIGYGHTSYWTSDRDDSVPYAYGYMARDLALDFLGSGRDIPKYKEIGYKDVENK